jgi:hypothetical protein
MKKELSPEELEWVYNNIETVRAVMKGQSTPDDFSKNVPDPSPLAVVKAHLQGNLKKKLQKIEKSRADFQENMVRFKRYLNEGTPELKVYAEERIAELASDDFELNAASHIEVLQLKLELLDVDPAQVFLPIGTIVRIIGVPEYRDVTRLSDDRNNYPVVGSIGVVVSLHGSNDMPIGVAFRDEYKDGWGTTYYPDYDRVPTYRVEREMLEVVGYSLLPDGTEYKGSLKAQDIFGGFTTLEERKVLNFSKPRTVWRSIPGSKVLSKNIGGEHQCQACEAIQNKIGIDECEMK